MKSDTCREKVKGKRAVYRRSELTNPVGSRCNRSLLAANLQPIISPITFCAKSPKSDHYDWPTG